MNKLLCIIQNSINVIHILKQYYYLCQIKVTEKFILPCHTFYAKAMAVSAIPIGNYNSEVFNKIDFTNYFLFPTV